MANRGYHRTTPTKVARTSRVQAHRAAAVTEHVQRHGWVCLGDTHHPRHRTRDLVADDPIPIARGGDPLQPLVVMCRSANSRKGATLDTPRTPQAQQQPHLEVHNDPPPF